MDDSAMNRALNDVQVHSYTRIASDTATCFDILFAKTSVTIYCALINLNIRFALLLYHSFRTALVFVMLLTIRNTELTTE